MLTVPDMYVAGTCRATTCGTASVIVGAVPDDPEIRSICVPDLDICPSGISGVAHSVCDVNTAGSTSVDLRCVCVSRPQQKP